jgi:hypothetical protein
LASGDLRNKNGRVTGNAGDRHVFAAVFVLDARGRWNRPVPFFG